ncbi:hypothetical protein J1N35_043974 [Gossypium stocksii]|uniref:RRM domain-containing protein n=1 Tax=Gossypium stocksii TaxID=47602 RepID=A0A9D3U8H3_9ROSI|nr:hypothetical protein J1N35_043974 [Gossypium stocksii]
MSEDVEYRCFIGNLSWATTDSGLKDAFEKFGNLLDAKVAVDKFSGRSRGFGFVSFDDKAAMEEAIEAMNGMDLDGRNITVDKAKPHQGSVRDSDGDRSRDHGRDHDRDRNRGYYSGRRSHVDHYGGGGGSSSGRYGPDWNGDRFGGRSRDAGSRGGGGAGAGGDRYNRDRSGPYECRGTGGPRS